MAVRKRYKGRYPASKLDEKGGEKRRLRERKLSELSESYRAVFNGTGGPADAEAVIEDLIDFCRVGRGTMTGNSWTYFNEGKAEVGRRILQLAGIGISHEMIS